MMLAIQGTDKRTNYTHRVNLAALHPDNSYEIYSTSFVNKLCSLMEGLDSAYAYRLTGEIIAEENAGVFHSVLSIKLMGWRSDNGVEKAENRRRIQTFNPSAAAQRVLQLEQNIINDGCRDPIVVWHDTIVDGHNRYEICMRHSIPFDTKDMEFECREAAVAWICANQLGRRNITEETRKFLIGMQYENEKLVTRIRNKIGRNQHTLDISTMDEEDADKACRHWTAQRIAEDNNVSAATVQKYAIFTRALEEIGKKEPKLVPKILSGQYKIAHKHVLEMAELNPQDLRRINRKIDRNPAEFMHYKATRPVVQGNKTVYSEGDISTGPSVKDMPEYDPDAEISSLTLTIPSWKSSIERAKNTADLTIVSPQAKGDLAQALRELRNTIADMLSEVEDI